jgi:hypothetical protein
MTWTEKLSKDNSDLKVSADRAKELETTKAESVKHLDSVAKPFEPIRLQPVRSPGLYEAEFGVKGDDIIFHFWPYGYRAAERSGALPPKFKRNFAQVLKDSMDKSFGSNRVALSEDTDVGAWFVLAKGWGINQFNRDLAIKACEAVHKGLGGTEG